MVSGALQREIPFRVLRRSRAEQRWSCDLPREMIISDIFRCKVWKDAGEAADTLWPMPLSSCCHSVMTPVFTPLSGNRPLKPTLSLIKERELLLPELITGDLLLTTSLHSAPLLLQLQTAGAVGHKGCKPGHTKELLLQQHLHLRKQLLKYDKIRCQKSGSCN